MNILSFDIEEWAVAKSSGFGSPTLYAEYDAYLDRILNALDEKQCKATFFCTGQMAQFFPNVVKLIYERGHEVGCHSHVHTWMNKMTRDEAMDDTRKAVIEIEQCIGEKVLSYRAPAFSIGVQNPWMFEVLSVCGIERDASVFPADRDLGGFPQFRADGPCWVAYQGTRIKEYPIRMAFIAGRKMAFSGGGYFRFFPLDFVSHQFDVAPYTMCYFHIGDLVTESIGFLSKAEYETYFKEAGTIKARFLRYIKSNLGKRHAMDKLMRLLSMKDFVNIAQADTLWNWDSEKMISI